MNLNTNHNDMTSILLYFQIKNKGNWMDTYNDLSFKVDINRKDMLEAITRVNKKISNEYTALGLIDEGYPDELKRWYKPPFIVFKFKNEYFYFYGRDLQNMYQLDLNNEADYHEFMGKEGLL